MTCARARSCETAGALARALGVLEASICPLAFVSAYEQDSLGHLRVHCITPEWRETHKQRRGPQRGRPPRGTGKAGASGGSASALPSKSEWDDRTSKARRRKRGADADEDASTAGAARPRRGRPPTKKAEAEEQQEEKEQEVDDDPDLTCSAAGPVVDVASLVPVKYTLLENTDGRFLKMRGEEYRLWAGHGWYWLSCTRHSTRAPSATLVEAADTHEPEPLGLGYASTRPDLLLDEHAIVNYQRHPGDRKCLMFVHMEALDVSAALRGENQLLRSRRGAPARTYKLDALLVRRQRELSKELEVVAAKRAEQTRMSDLARRLAETATGLERYRVDLLELARTQRLARVRTERLVPAPLDFVLRLVHKLSAPAPAMMLQQARVLKLDLSESDLYSLIEAVDQLEVCTMISAAFSLCFLIPFDISLFEFDFSSGVQSDEAERSISWSNCSFTKSNCQ